MSVFLNEEVSSKVFYVFKKLKEIANHSEYSLSLDKEKIRKKTIIQSCLNYEFSSELENSIKKILLDYAFKAEQISPGSFKETINVSNDLLEEKFSTTKFDIAFHPSIDDLKKIIDSLCLDKELTDLCYQSICLSGFCGKISIEKSLNSETSIELIDGYTFKHENLGLNSIKLKKPRVICIDGYIESVSEANLLFEGAVQLKHPLVIISRGMSDDVLNTIKVNRDRKSMFVYPVKISFDLQGINTISDISTVIGKPPVSCNLGHLISSTKIDDSVEIDEIFISGNSLVIKNSKTRSSVNSHIKSLIEKRNSSNIEVEELLTARIKSLSNNCVVIRLPNDCNYVSKSQSIDYVLRSIKSMLDYGIIIDNDEIKLYGSYKFSREISEKLHSMVKNINAYID